MSDQNTRREESRDAKPAEVSEVDLDEPVARRTPVADPTPVPPANSCVESIVAALIDEESLGRVRQNQKETYVALLTRYRDMYVLSAEWKECAIEF